MGLEHLKLLNTKLAAVGGEEGEREKGSEEGEGGDGLVHTVLRHVWLLT